MRSAGRCLMAFALIAILLVSRATAQTLSEQQIKAGFLLNFTRFVEWPPKAFAAHETQIVLCIVDEPSIFTALAGSVSGMNVDRRAVSVRQMKWNEDLRSCNVLFLSLKNERHTARVLQSLHGSSILTVGEQENFLESGGMIRFLVQENHVKMDLDLDAAAAEQLKVSARLIAVSHLVSGDPAKKGN